jgi:hypothetical protein
MKHVLAGAVLLGLVAPAGSLFAQFAAGPGGMTGVPHAAESYLHTAMHANQYQVVMGHRRAVTPTLALGVGAGLLGRSETSDMLILGADAQLGLIGGERPLSLTASVSRFTKSAPSLTGPGGHSMTLGLAQEYPLTSAWSAYLHSRWERSDQVDVCKLLREESCAPWTGLRGEGGVTYSFSRHAISWGAVTGDPVHARGGLYMRVSSIR